VGRNEGASKSVRALKGVGQYRLTIWRARNGTIFFVEVEVAGSGIRLDLFALQCALDVDLESMSQEKRHTFTSHWPALNVMRASVAMVTVHEWRLN
jgi:hypothetical protein